MLTCRLYELSSHIFYIGFLRVSYWWLFWKLGYIMLFWLFMILTFLQWSLHTCVRLPKEGEPHSSPRNQCPPHKPLKSEFDATQQVLFGSLLAGAQLRPPFGETGEEPKPKITQAYKGTNHNTQEGRGRRDFPGGALLTGYFQVARIWSVGNWRNVPYLAHTQLHFSGMSCGFPPRWHSLGVHKFRFSGPEWRKANLKFSIFTYE